MEKEPQWDSSEHTLSVVGDPPCDKEWCIGETNSPIPRAFSTRSGGCNKMKII